MKQLFLFLLIVSGAASFAQRPSEDAQKLKNSRRDLWYADSSFARSDQNKDTNEGATTQKRTPDSRMLNKITAVLGGLVGALILGALGYAFYTFSNPGKKKQKKEKTKAPDSPAIETADALHQTDFTALIQAAETRNDYRLALRYHYLRLLQEFSRQGLIRYEKNKTNRQYAEEIRHHKWGPDFQLATRYYNFVWYGEYPLHEDSYRSLVIHFNKMLPYE